MTRGLTDLLRRHWPLLLAAATATIAVYLLVAEPPAGVRAALGLALLATPGPALLAAVVPGTPHDFMVRAMIALSLGFAVLALGAVALNAAQIPLDATSFTWLAAGVAIAAGLMGELRGAPVPTPARLLPHPGLATSLALVAAVGIAAACVVVSSRPSSARAIAGYSALWTAPVSRDTYRVGVVNQQPARTSYTVTVMAGARPVQQMRVTLAPGAQWTRRLSATVNAARVTQVLLRRDGMRGVYRHVQLPYRERA